ncbi:MAG: HNH endonuclease, partial [Gammaproteobacteria bacterium]|nr:HNH endonuclease [Gammaproteobacteria bacterium]
MRMMISAVTACFLSMSRMAMGECFAHGRYFGDGMCPKCSELGKKGVLSGRKQRTKIPYRYDGKGQCRWCGRKPKPPRRTWCSQECVDEYLIRTDPKVARAKVYGRDRGVCAICKVDTQALQTRVRHLYIISHNLRATSTGHPRPVYLGIGTPNERELRAPPEHIAAWITGLRAAALFKYNEAAQLLRDHGIDVPNLAKGQGSFHAHELVTGRTLWEMDHIVPVSDGGGGCGLDNLRTLCIPCHKSESARLAAFAFIIEAIIGVFAGVLAA